MPITAARSSPGMIEARPEELARAPRGAVLGDVWLALWSSRLAVWLAGTYAILAVGYRPTGVAPHTGAPFGDLGELLLGPAQRWDGAYYVSIAVHSYHPGPLSAFFPLYPITIAALNIVVGSPLIAGILISLASFAVALYLLHRLTTIELGAEHARTAVLALAFFPTALFFSATYAEALLLALMLGAVYAARTGHWAWAGILGALASATHTSGVLVALPIAVLYLYGPRADREVASDKPQGKPAGASLPWWRPRYRPRADILWVFLVPVGILAFFAYMGLQFGDALRPLHVNDELWHRHFELLGGVTRLPEVLWHSLRSIDHASPNLLFPATNGPFRGAAANLLDTLALVFAVVASVAVVKRLPLAYSAYTLVALVVFASAPKATEPLMSMPRFIVILFPLQMALAGWLDERRGRAAVWIACSAVALGALSMQFATGRWVA